MSDDNESADMHKVEEESFDSQSREKKISERNSSQGSAKKEKKKRDKKKKDKKKKEKKKNESHSGSEVNNSTSRVEDPDTAPARKKSGSSYNVSNPSSSSSSSRNQSSNSNYSQSRSSSSSSSSSSGSKKSSSSKGEKSKNKRSSDPSDASNNSMHSKHKDKREKKKKGKDKEGKDDKISAFVRLVKDIHEAFEKDGTLWEDPEFPPLNDSIFKDLEKMKKMNTDYKSNGWYRPKQINKQATFCVNEKGRCDLKFGSMSDGVFAGALALISIHPCVENLMIDINNMDKGYVAFQFFKNGEWQYVVVDTLLPYSEINKSHIFTECMDNKEYWVQLLEKAYAKLNGSYENIQGMDIKEVLVDLTGGVSDRIVFSDNTKFMDDNVYPMLDSSIKQHFIVGCIKRVENKSLAAKDVGEKGILENYYHGIMGNWEFPQQDGVIKLIKIRNYWGVEGNWSGDWCNHGEDWDRNKDIREALMPDQKNKGKDDQDQMQWFLKYEDWCKEFNQMIICKVFPSWKHYSVHGVWSGKSAGGSKEF